MSEIQNIYFAISTEKRIKITYRKSSVRSDILFNKLIFSHKKHIKYIFKIPQVPLKIIGLTIKFEIFFPLHKNF